MSVDMILKNMQVARESKKRFDIQVGDTIQKWVERTGLFGWIVNYRFLEGTGAYRDVGRVATSEDDKRQWGHYQDMTVEEATRVGFPYRVIRVITDFDEHP